MSRSNATPHINCHACGAPLRDYTTGTCRHCGRVNDLDFRHLQGAAVSSGQTPQSSTCPRCRVQLVALKFTLGETFFIERCKACLGTYFRVADLEALMRLAASEGGVDRARLERLTKEQKEIWPISYIPCPSCPELMQRTRFGRSTVIVDRCKTHGAWLDGGELGRLLLWAQAGGLGVLEHSVWEEGS